MKKIVSILFIMQILLICTPSAYSQATLTISNVNGSAGNPVAIPVMATGISDMAGFQFTIAYDQTKLTYLDCTNWGGGTDTSSSAMLITPKSDGKVTFVYNGDPVNITAGKFFDLNFTVNTDATESVSVLWSDIPTPRELSNSIPEAISCVYTNGAVHITTTSISLTVNFNAGWNLFSSNNVPGEADLKTIFQPLITAGKLVKIQDEIGKSLEDYGIFGGWINNIGDLSLTEGYKIKVTSGCQITFTGRPASFPFNIPLKAGWNIMGFPPESSLDGLMVVQDLINRKVLVKVQDETGKSIEDFGIFGGWKNFIGNFNPGKGYKLKVNANDILTFSLTLPSVTTLQPDSITSNSAILGGEVTQIGMAEVTERGVCYGTTETPTTLDNKMVSGRGIGTFKTKVTDLKDSTIYYARAYAVNSIGISYGEQISFTTRLFRNKYDGLYEVTAISPMVDIINSNLTGYYPFTYELITSGPYSCKCREKDIWGDFMHPILSGNSVSGYGSFGLEVFFDPSGSGKIIDVKNPWGNPPANTRMPAIDPSGVNSWDPLTKNIEFKYFMKQPSLVPVAPNIRVYFDEKWTYKGPR